MAAWVSNNPNGIRQTLYTPDMAVNDYKYMVGAYSSLTFPHGIGFFFCSCLWDMYWAIIWYEEHNNRLGFNPNKYQDSVGGSNKAFQIVVEGLKFQGCSPNFVHSRDGILAAGMHLYNDSTMNCVIWQVFARRGLGDGAVSQSVSSFSIPDSCTGGLSLPARFWPHSAPASTASPSANPSNRRSAAPT